MSEPQKNVSPDFITNDELDDDFKSDDNGHKGKSAPEPASVFLPDTVMVPRATARSWFFTLMCMNIPIAGWFYMMYLACSKKYTDRKSFAQAYLLYKLIFFIIAAIILGIACCIGLGVLDKLLDYMDQL